ncbi:MAG TPA: chorismate mutase, partial [Candidatus Eisenbacteria bacterium]|nr:chorismate mutase [Candidatus Eisenbacteria bacterium]
MSGRVAAVRGAVQVAENSVEAILAGTTRLLLALIEANAVTPERIVSALFTTTADLDADFPAHAARRLGWTEVPMLNAREIPVPGSLPRAIRVLLTLRDVPGDAALTPIYLEGAAA